MIAWCIASVLRLLDATIRWEHRFASTSVAADEPAIFAFWHNRQILMPMVHRRLKGKAVHNPIVTLISQHRDGQLAVKIIEKFGLHAVAGSSTRGGKRALLQLVRILGSGKNIAITPDGPRGPIYSLKEGTIKLAQLSGRPIYPVVLAAKRVFQLGSWDKMIIPLPFTRAISMVGEPIHIPREVDPDTFEKFRRKVEDSLNALTQAADCEIRR